MIYNDEDRVPVGKDGEIIYKPPKKRNPERIKIELPTGANLIVKDNEIIINWNKASIKMDGSGDIKIKASKSIELMSDSEIKITSNKKIVLGSGRIEIKTSPGIYAPKDSIEVSTSDLKVESKLKSEFKSLEAKIETTAVLDIISNTILNLRGTGMVNIKGGVINLN